MVSDERKNKYKKYANSFSTVNMSQEYTDLVDRNVFRH